MAPGDDDGRALGRVEGLIEGLKQTVNHFATTWAEQDRQATEGRRIMHTKVDAARAEAAETRAEVSRLVDRIEGLRDLPAKFAALESKVEPFITDVSSMKLTVNKLDKAYTQGTGLAGLAKYIWMAAAGAVGALLVKYGPG